MRTCGACGELNADRARFCQSCGRPLAVEEPIREVRKTVTVLFADVTGSTGLGERLDPESLRRVMARFFEEMASIVERHGGTVEKFIGDAVMAVFGVPVVHEDDALRAVRAATEMQAGLRSLNGELQRVYGVAMEMRIGVNTGEVVTGDLVAGQRFVAGDAVNVAARLEQAAPPGEILIGERTFRLVQHVVVAEPTDLVRLRGKEEPVRTWHLLEVTSADLRAGRGLRSPMVGRGGELSLLREAFELTVRDRSPHVFTVLGSAGVGKSRLVDEATANLPHPAEVFQGRCLAYGEAITFWPIAEVVRQSCGISAETHPEEARAAIAAQVGTDEHADRIAEGVAQVIGLAGATGTPEETFWGVRRFLEIAASRRPLITVFDDIHWAEPAFLDLLEYLADFATGPILFLSLARPELLDLRPTWSADRQNAMTITLSPLTETESATLIDNLLGRTGLDEKALRQITETSEGNPLFIEEIVRMLIDEGAIAWRDGRWVPSGDVGSYQVPATITALLNTRLERLDPDERAVLQRASVVGKVFEWGAVAALSPESERAEVGRHLRALVRKELITPSISSFASEDAFRFRHMLIRDAAYEGIPKESRADLHERFAGWAEGRLGGRVTEFEEIIGHHLEQACRNLLAVGRPDERTGRLAERAADRLASAGRRAFRRGDVPAAVNLLPRAADLLPRGNPIRTELLSDLAQALMSGGELGRANASLAEAIESGRAAGDARVVAHATLLRQWILLHTEPEGKTEAIRRKVQDVLPELEKLGDEEGLARATYLLVEIDWMACRYGAAERGLEQVVEHAHRAGDRRQEMEALYRQTAAVLYGTRPVEAGIRRCREIFERAGGDQLVEAGVLIAEAELRAMLGRFEGTREQLARARSILSEMGLTFHALSPLQRLGELELLAGDPAAAEERFREAYEALEALGERGFLSTFAAALAQATYEQDRLEDAERFTRVSEETAASDDVTSQVMLRGIRGKVLARRGHSEEALKAARAAVELAEPTDALDLRGDAWMNLAEVHRLAGRPADAVAAAEEAVRLYEEKGNLVSARRARATLQQLPPARGTRLTGSSGKHHN